MRQRIAVWLRALADKLDPPVKAEPTISIPIAHIPALLTGTRVGPCEHGVVYTSQYGEVDTTLSRGVAKEVWRANRGSRLVINGYDYGVS
jgi:hypothetical protein